MTGCEKNKTLILEPNGLYWLLVRTARLGYITNQPRTFGLYGHVKF